MSPVTSSTATSMHIGSGGIQVEPWGTERPLFIACVVVSIVAWGALAVSLVGLLYGALFGLFFFVMHAVFVAHIRGNGVRLSPEQFPELHERVQRLARRMGLEPLPDVYLMQAGGALNAFATKFLGSSLVVLYSDLLEACGENRAAADMIIGHELGHIRAGHFRWRWLIFPALMVPFLGKALSRAREYTCDRWGLAGAGDRESALLGLTILAAGGALAPAVNRRAFARQRADMTGWWMSVGQWLSTHPPLAHRLAAIDPTL
ncbi:MAG TPA: M48 family metallopeptidase [Longimicrobiales bacterium]|nr:M48 family metallopeptidase [Longimicrobiales bacterium]